MAAAELYELVRCAHCEVAWADVFDCFECGSVGPHPAYTFIGSPQPSLGRVQDLLA